MLKTFAISTLFFLMFSIGASEATAQNWKNLGTKEVTDKEESDVFHVGSRKGQFRALKLFVSRRAIRFYKVEVTYQNGDTTPLEVRALIPAGGESRVLDLPGNNRYIATVKFWYEAASVGAGQKALITLYGLK